MNKIRMLLLAILLFLGCPVWLAGQDAPPSPADDPSPSSDQALVTVSPEVRRVAQGNNAFGFRLLSELSKENPGNLFYSPFSIHICFGMPFTGAAGRTAEEIAGLMEYPLKEGDLAPEFGAYLRLFPGLGSETATAAKYEMLIANGAWAEKSYPFDPAYVSRVKDLFASDFHLCDFKTKAEEIRGEINTWVAAVTREKIPELIPNGLLTALTRLVLVNAIYFKGQWEDPFEKSATVDKPFFPTFDKILSLPTMQKTFEIPYFENESLQMVGLPYKGNEIKMYVVLPRAMDGLPAVERSLTAETFEQMVSVCSSRETILSLPRFKLDTGFYLSKSLQALGLKEAFVPTADFSRLLQPGKGPSDLMISEVIHKAFVAVDEEGTEAAAATAIVMNCTVTSVQERSTPKVFQADHPFLFFLRHEPTSAILFMGRVSNPEDS